MQSVEVVITSAKLVPPHRRKPFAVKLLLKAGKLLAYTPGELLIGGLLLDLLLPNPVPTDKAKRHAAPTNAQVVTHSKRPSDRKQAQR